MMDSDPRFANNPMLQQSLRSLQSNPEMIQQLSRMMGDPNNGIDRMMSNMMQQQQQQGGSDGTNASSGNDGSTGVDPFAGGPESMQRLMEQFQQNSQRFGGSSGGVGGGFGSGRLGSDTGGGDRNASTNSAAVRGSGNRTNDDTDMTEEEMIAEAIARSLREP